MRPSHWNIKSIILNVQYTNSQHDNWTELISHSKRAPNSLIRLLNVVNIKFKCIRMIYIAACNRMYESIRMYTCCQAQPFFRPNRTNKHTSCKVQHTHKQNNINIYYSVLFLFTQCQCVHAYISCNVYFCMCRNISDWKKRRRNNFCPSQTNYNGKIWKRNCDSNLVIWN